MHYSPHNNDIQSISFSEVKVIGLYQYARSDLGLHCLQKSPFLGPAKPNDKLDQREETVKIRLKDLHNAYLSSDNLIVP